MGVIDKTFSTGFFSATPFHLLDEDAQKKVLVWRNDSRIRVWMDNPEIISVADHLTFCKNLAFSSTELYVRVDFKETPIGVISLTDIKFDEGVAGLGVYKFLDQSVGCGNDLMHVLHALAKSLKICRLLLWVQKTNDRAITLYKKLGYRVDVIKDEYIYMEKEL